MVHRRSPLLIPVIAAVPFVGSSPLVAAQSLPAPVLHWESYEPGVPWRLKETTLGNHGTQVFCQTRDDAQAWFLLSRQDDDPPAYIWFDDTETDQCEAAASAAAEDVHVSMAYDSFTGNERILRLRRFSSQGLDWTYTYPELTTGFVHAAVSDDGQTIATCWSNSVTMQTEVVVFAPDAPMPLATWSLPPGPTMDFEMTPDGRLAALTVNPRTFVLDLETGATLFTYDHGVFLAGSSAVALSRDGGLLAFGGQSGTLRLYEWNGSSYDFATSVPWPGGAAVTALAFSADGSTLAFGHSSIFIGSPGTTAHISCLDVPSRTVTMEETLESFGLWVNYPIEIEIAADGSWFVAALAGDQPQLWDEVRFYEKHANEPFATFPSNGSAVALGLSPDEAWMVVASNHDHLTTAQEGGEIQVWRLREPDIDLSPAPRVGSPVDIDVRTGAVGDSVFVAAAFRAEDPPLDIPGVGTLYVELASLVLVYAGTTSPDGTATLSVTLPSSPALVGQDFFLQGYALPAGTLTEDWSLLTLLP